MISVAIMAHPRRVQFVEELVESLDYPAEVVWDRIGDRWDTGSRAVLAYDPAASHHLVLQDDAIVSVGLVPAIIRTLDQVGPQSPLSLYVGRLRPYREKLERSIRHINTPKLLVISQLLWGVGVVYPTEQLDDVVAYGASVKDLNYDLKMSRWYELHDVPVYYTYPSLVDHRQEPENPSLIPRRHGNRYAHWFEPDATDIYFEGVRTIFL